MSAGLGEKKDAATHSDDQRRHDLCECPVYGIYGKDLSDDPACMRNTGNLKLARGWQVSVGLLLLRWEKNEDGNVYDF